MIITQEILNRFWTKVNKTDTCWNWIGAKNEKQYGNFNINKKILKAHRISWTIHNGEIPDGLNVLHKCDNPSCIRPDHLFLGTLSDNTQDSISKGRNVTSKYPKIFAGSGNGNSILNENQVLEIRNRSKNGEKQINLAEEFNVKPETISKIINYKRWTHI